MMPDTAARTLRQVAEVLREIDLWDDNVLRELVTTSRRLDLIADCVDDKIIEFPANVASNVRLHSVNGYK